ncbi:hypothetical protein [Nocardia concava]|uniref:hypothetical protein n=1 Tax=Nocardia concava TaxID=257281 RepID=UPI0002FC1EFE|nr:hypothetical protein [Nocardia concava]
MNSEYTERLAGVSVPQMRAVARVLDLEVDEFAVGANLLVEQAQLLATVHAVLGQALRTVIVGAPLGHCTQTWSAAATAAHAALARSGTSVSEQAQFEVNWVRQRIALLAMPPGPTPRPALLAAASLAAEAASTLLALERDPVGAGAHSGWAAAISDLSLAFHLADDEYRDLTQPVD